MYNEKTWAALLKRRYERLAIIKESYYRNPKRCPECGNVIVYEKRKLTFCSRECSIKFRNHNPNPTYKAKRIKDTIFKCLACGKENKGKKVCDSKCAADVRYKRYISRWLEGKEDGGIGKYKDSISHRIKRYLREKYNNRCTKCDWHEINPTTGKVPLEVNHIDGNHKNNKEENLELLCPNCHSLTYNFKALNKGKGRNYRYLLK